MHLKGELGSGMVDRRASRWTFDPLRSPARPSIWTMQLINHIARNHKRRAPRADAPASGRPQARRGCADCKP
jgi:hypothetical protein